MNFVNLRYISEHYGYAPDRVMKMRERGDHFLAIDRVADRETKGKDRYGCGEGKYGKDSKRQCKGSTRKGKEGDVYKRALATLKNTGIGN